MAGRSFGEDFRNELTGKAIVWGPAITGAILAGPIGFVAGLAASVAVIVSGAGDKPQHQAGDTAGQG